MKRPESDRAGRVERQQDGHTVFIPNPLPPRIGGGPSLWHRLGEAERALGWISGRAAHLDDAAPYAALALRKEAVLSARLEGNRVALSDLLWYSLDGAAVEGLQAPRGVVQAALNYVHAVERLLPATGETGDFHSHAPAGASGALRGIERQGRSTWKLPFLRDMDRAFRQLRPGCPFRPTASSGGSPDDAGA